MNSACSDLSVKSSALNVERSGSTAAVDPDSPWLGLASFTEETRAFFHGRDEEIGELSRRVQRKLLTVLFGQSGLGKTSILRAGVVPRLRAEGYCPVYVRIDYSREAPDPLEQIKQTVKEALRAGETTSASSAATPAEISPGASGASLWEFFHHRDKPWVDAGGRPLIPLVIFDQFEEIFTLAQGDDFGRERAARFINALADLVENRVPQAVEAKLENDDRVLEQFDFGRADYRILISLREDYLPHLEGLKARMPSVTQNRMRLAHMNGLQALDAVIKPGGALVTPEIARAIVEFVSGARGGSVERLAELEVEPPLLSVICRELNDRRRALGQTQITADLVTGNRREILTDFYERSVADLPEAMRRFVEDKLLTKSGFRDNLALETALEEPGVTRPLIDTLVSRRLLRIEDRIGTQRVELTHDVLAEVIRASRDARQQRLALAEVQERERRTGMAAAQRTRRLRWVIGGLAAALIALCIAGAFGLRARRIALQNASRTDVAFAAQLLEQGRTADGLAYLVRAAAKDPHNPVIAPRLASLLTSRNFALPEGAPLKYPGRIRDLRFTSDGQRLAIVCDDGTLGFIAVADGTRFDLKIPSRNLGVGWAGDRAVARGADGVVRVVNVQTAAIEREFRYEKRIVAQLVQVDQVSLAWLVLADNTVIKADLISGDTTIMPFKLGNALYTHFRVTRDGRWVAVRENQSVRVFDLTSVKPPIELQFPGEAKNFGFVREGEAPVVIMTYVRDPKAVVYRLSSAVDGRTLGEPRVVSNASVTNSVALRTSPDFRYFSLSTGVGVQVFDAETGLPVGRFRPTPGTRQDLGFSADSRYHFVSGMNGGTDVWDFKTDKTEIAAINQDHITATASLDATGKLVLTTSTSGVVRLWNLQTGTLVVEPTLQPSIDVVATLSPDGRRFAIGTSDGTVYRLRAGQNAARPLNVAGGMTLMPGSPPRLLHILERSRAELLDAASMRQVSAFSFPEAILPSENRRGVGIREDGTMMVVRTVRGNTWQAWRLDPSGVTHAVTLDGAPSGSGWIGFSPRADLVAIIFNDDLAKVHIWNAATGARVGKPMPLSARANTGGNIPGDFSRDATRLAVGVDSGVVHVWDMTTGKELYQIPRLRPAAGARNVRYNPDGTVIYASNSWGEARLWQAASGEPASPIMYHSDSISAAEFSADGKLIATASRDGTAQVWDGHTGAAVGERLSHKSVLRAVRLSDDGRRVLTASEDMTIRIWDVRTSQPLTEPLAHSARVTNAWLSSDGAIAYAVSGAGAYLWSLPPLNGDASVPEWLLELAAICASKRVTEEGKFVAAGESMGEIEEVRRTLAAMSNDALYAEWGRWFLADPAKRSIAPGLTVTPAEAAIQVTAPSRP